MGHIVNPISYRLYNLRYWNSNWFTFNKNNYSYLFTQDVLLINLSRKLLIKYFNTVSVGLIFLNLKILKSFDSTNLYFYIHDSFLDILLFNLSKNADFLKLRNKVYKKFFKQARILKKKYYRLTKKKIKILKSLVYLKYAKNFLKIFLKNKVLKRFWENFKATLNFYLQKFFLGYSNLKIFIIGLSKNYVNASIISEFFFIRLKQFYTIWEVLRNVNVLFKKLMRSKRILGYKITCSGRFSRKQRTTYSWKSFGSLASSSKKSKLDYSYKNIALKYSSCTIKVWIRLSNRKSNGLFEFII